MPQTTEIDVAQRLRLVTGRIVRLLRPTDASGAGDLTPTRVVVLMTTAKRGPIGLSEIAAEEKLNPTLLSRTVACLAEMGLVVRVPDPQDRRAAMLQVTEAGEELAQRIRRQRTHAVESALAELSPEDRELIADAIPALERLAEQLLGRASA